MNILLIGFIIVYILNLLYIFIWYILLCEKEVQKYVGFALDGGMEGYRLICCLPTTTEGWLEKGGLIACLEISYDWVINPPSITQI